MYLNLIINCALNQNYLLVAYYVQATVLSA